ncbi:MAG: mannose-1-phosphate guanylyltransferase [Schleiferiaceae bacterium]|jgi:mannose-1-phosphate guanylyltransferase
MEHNYAVIMAGGVGSRFWPTSTSRKPKQFLDILGTGETLLQQTFRRMKSVVPADHIYVVTHADYAEACLEQLPELDRPRILAEPARRNTAPCVAYAGFVLKKRDPLANFVVTPADHLVTHEAEFTARLRSALNTTAAHNVLMTLGMNPTRPETGYGYIQFRPETSEYARDVHPVKTFTEKPNREMAEQFIATGEFLWNAGIFVWNANAILSAFEKHMPEMYASFNAGWAHYGTPSEGAFIGSMYGECPNESIDYGILEKAKQVLVMPAEFGWSDLGSWGAVHEQRAADAHGNTGGGPQVLSYDATGNTYLIPEDMVAVVDGLHDYIVILSENRLLVCPRSKEQEIKQFVNDVKMRRGEDFV